MNRDQAKQLVRDTFTHRFHKDNFRRFIRELLNRYDEGKASTWTKQYIPDAFKKDIDRYERLGTYTTSDGDKLDVLIVHLTLESKLERARTALRNFVAHHLKARDEKDAALVAFVSPTEQTWRFSFVKMEYATAVGESGRVSVYTNLTPARRSSYLVGEGESSHTAQSRFVALLQETTANPTLDDIADAFSVETVTKEFFTQYFGLFRSLKAAIENITTKDKAVRDEFKVKRVSAEDFAKKLLGQIVFLYFLQKKGWLGVPRGAEWGSGPRDFLRLLARGEHVKFGNFFDEVLEPLFYDTLATDRGTEAWCARFKTRIPFLNGGLFEPLGQYDWKNTALKLPNEIFFNTEQSSDGDTGTGILDVFDRYNFTVNESEPLEQEVAIDPEMLGKVFENLIEENLRKGAGAFYTPREIVHYMCQEALISYLHRAVNEGEGVAVVPQKASQDRLFGDAAPVQGVLAVPVSREDLAALVHLGDQAAHYEAAFKAGTTSYEKKDRPRLPKPVEAHAKKIDQALRDIAVCDPAIGSGAFPVGMMTEIVRARLALNPYFMGESERTAYRFKRHAIHNCLYGVDIDRGAVEIAKLRLWLSLVVDEEDTKEIRPLPNLDFKIVAGNSLLSFPFQSHGLSDIEKLKAEYFDEAEHDHKASLKERIEARIEAHLANSQKSLGYSVDFDYRLFFSEVFRQKGGFDVVIANPPYLSAIEFKKYYPKEEREALNRLFQTAHGTYDIYILFIEKGVELLRPAGTLSFINPNKYLAAKYAVALREFLLREVRLERLVDVSGIRVFESAAVYPVLSFMVKGDREDGYPVTLVLPRRRELEKFDLSAYTTHQVSSKLLTALPEHIWGFLLSNQIDLLLRLIKHTKPLSEIAEINATTTAAEADAYGAHLTETCSKGALKVINTGTIDRYAVRWGREPLTHGGRRFVRPHLPLGKAQVNERRSDMYGSPKVVLAKMAKQCEAYFDEQGEFAALNTNCIYSPKTGVPLSFIAGFCNSQLFMFFYSQFFGALRMSGGYFQFQSPQLRVIPFKPPTKDVQNRTSTLVKKISEAKADDPDADTARWEQEIEDLLHKLYEVTDADAKSIAMSGGETTFFDERQAVPSTLECVSEK